MRKRLTVTASREHSPDHALHDARSFTSRYSGLCSSCDEPGDRVQQYKMREPVSEFGHAPGFEKGVETYYRH